MRHSKGFRSLTASFLLVTVTLQPLSASAGWYNYTPGVNFINYFDVSCNQQSRDPCPCANSGVNASDQNSASDATGHEKSYCEMVKVNDDFCSHEKQMIVMYTIASIFCATGCFNPWPPARGIAEGMCKYSGYALGITEIIGTKDILFGAKSWSSNKTKSVANVWGIGEAGLSAAFGFGKLGDKILNAAAPVGGGSPAGGNSPGNTSSNGGGASGGGSGTSGGGGAPAGGEPAGGGGPAPAGGETPAPAGGETPAPAGGETPAPAGGETPAPAGGDGPAPAGGETPAPAADKPPTDKPADATKSPEESKKKKRSASCGTLFGNLVMLQMKSYNLAFINSSSDSILTKDIPSVSQGAPASCEDRAAIAQGKNKPTGPSGPARSTGLISSNNATAEAGRTLARDGEKSLEAFVQKGIDSGQFAQSAATASEGRVKPEDFQNMFRDFKKITGLDPVKVGSDALKNGPLNTIAKFTDSVAGLPEVAEEIRNADTESQNFAKTIDPSKFQGAGGMAARKKSQQDFASLFGAKSAGATGPAVSEVKFGGFEGDIWHAGTTKSIFEIVSDRTRRSYRLIER